MTETLAWLPAVDHPGLVAPPVAAAIAKQPDGIEVAVIDPADSDTEKFCARYGIELAAAANCVVVAAKRGGETRYAACLVLATTRADVNNLVRKHLGARKCTFASLDDVVTATGMAYGGVTPFGLPDGWPILIDEAVAAAPWAVVGAGTRAAKLGVPGAALVALPGAEVLPGLGMPR
jgi:prolyl-tRNA editing enzyme YbaK/EbsC (Cys-tRNA(Pro) deacylase)